MFNIQPLIYNSTTPSLPYRRHVDIVVPVSLIEYNTPSSSTFRAPSNIVHSNDTTPSTDIYPEQRMYNLMFPLTSKPLLKNITDVAKEWNETVCV